VNNLNNFKEYIMQEDKKTIITLGVFFSLIGVVTVGLIVLSLYLS
tara:strand:- start:39 stop:173 length:135 start_codon:yes stop_codon:yes gene_type:complete